MNTLNSNGIVGFHSSVFDFHQQDTWYTSEKFKIKGIDNCNFVIVAQWSVDNNGILTISVTKDNEDRVSARITVSFYENEITRIVDNWTESCAFAGDTRSEWIGGMKISCEIVWYGPTKDSTAIQAPLNSFSDFKNFYLNSSLSDLQISISEEELPAHKFILAAHSPVFLSMFETDMKEKRENRIVIEGIELDVTKVVLSILYTGYDEDLNEVEMAIKVFIVAERYDMITLKRLCEWKLFQKLEVSNVLDILDKADNLNAGVLRTACINFIVQNKKQMVEKEDWKTICHQKPAIMCELLKTFMITL